MTIKVTDYERISQVTIHFDHFVCPKCGGDCKKSDLSFLYDCNICGRGWEQIDNNIVCLNDLYK